MKIRFNPLWAGLILIAALNAQRSTAYAQGTGFTYQGQLVSESAPYTGNAEFQPTLWNAATDGALLAGNSPAQVILAVTNGLFLLPLNFGANFPGADRWLQLEVRTTIGSFTTLTPRQPVTPTPYAITAGGLSGSLPAAQLSGVVASANLAGAYAGALTFSNTANSFSGAGPGLTSLNASQLTTGTVPDARLATNVARTNQVWLRGGNADTTAGTHFVGTTDQQPLEFKVNGNRALRLEPTTSGDTVNVIGGSKHNLVGAGAVGATIAGGAGGFVSATYTNRVDADFGTIAGGAQNTIQIGARFATLTGGRENTIQTNASESTLHGGRENTIQTEASMATLGGGGFNTIQNNANWATLSGGYDNTIQPNAEYATIPGGRRNRATNYAFAAGNRAKADHAGAFVWADSQEADFASTATNQFLIRAAGGVGIGTGAPEANLHIANGSAGAITASTATLLALENDTNALIQIMTPAGAFSGLFFGSPVNSLDASIRYNFFGSRELLFRLGDNVTRMVILTNGFVGIGNNSPTNRLMVLNARCDGSTWINASDRNLKQNFSPIDVQAVLAKVAALPIQSWSYREQPETPHVGPVAQDFYAAFELGGSATSIATVDADGVALAAIQGLNQKLERETKAKDPEIESLKQSLAELKQLVQTLVEKK